MDYTLLIALLAATVSLLLFGATLVLVAVLLVFVWRSRESAARNPWNDAPTPVPMERVERDTTLDRPTIPPTRSSSTVPSLDGGLIGFFDDEASAPGLEQRGKPDLFARRSGGWVDDPEEGEATEIFSAHSAAAELAEFAFDEADEATGRFSKTESR